MPLLRSSTCSGVDAFTPLQHTQRSRCLYSAPTRSRVDAFTPLQHTQRSRCLYSAPTHAAEYKPLLRSSTHSREKHSDHRSDPHPTSDAMKHVGVSASADVRWAIKYQRVLAVRRAINDEVMASHHVIPHAAKSVDDTSVRPCSPEIPGHCTRFGLKHHRK